MFIVCVIRVFAAHTPGNRHRLGIIVYAAKKSDKVDDGLGGFRSSSPSTTAANTSTPLAVLQLTGSRSRRRSSWKRLLLPTTYVQDALDSGDGVVRLRIVCDGCDATGRRLIVEPAVSATPSVVAAPSARIDDLPTPYLELIAKRSHGQHRRRPRRRHRHRLCPTTVNSVGTSRLATVMRRRC